MWKGATPPGRSPRRQAFSAWRSADYGEDTKHGKDGGDGNDTYSGRDRALISTLILTLKRHQARYAQDDPQRHEPQPKPPSHQSTFFHRCPYTRTASNGCVLTSSYEFLRGRSASDAPSTVCSERRHRRHRRRTVAFTLHCPSSKEGAARGGLSRRSANRRDNPLPA